MENSSPRARSMGRNRPRTVKVRSVSALPPKPTKRAMPSSTSSKGILSNQFRLTSAVPVRCPALTSRKMNRAMAMSRHTAVRGTAQFRQAIRVFTSVRPTEYLSSTGRAASMP